MGPRRGTRHDAEDASVNMDDDDDDGSIVLCRVEQRLEHYESIAGPRSMSKRNLQATFNTLKPEPGRRSVAFFRS